MKSPQHPNNHFGFYMHDTANAFRFQLEGNLCAQGAAELEQAWSTACSVIGSRTFIIDLSCVTSIDTSGKQLLRSWLHGGAQFAGKSPGANVLIESITGEPSPDTAAARKTSNWLPFRLWKLLATAR